MMRVFYCHGERAPLGYCMDNGYYRVVVLNLERLRAMCFVWFWLVLFHETVHYYCFNETLDLLYDKYSLINQLVKLMNYG